MSLASLASRHRPAIYLAIALLTLGGLFAIVSLPKGIYPEVPYPRIVVLALGGTLEARDMEVAVTRPIEAQMAGVIDLRQVRARTVRGGSEFSLDFRPGADMQFALQQVESRLTELRTSLPKGVQLTAERLTPSVFPIMQFILTGADPVVLHDIGLFRIRPRLAPLPDVGEVNVSSGVVRELSVILDPSRLVANHLTVPQVAEVIAATNVVAAAGRVDREYRQFTIVVSAMVTKPEEIADIVVRQMGNLTLRVRDLGTVRYGPNDRFVVTAGNGRTATLINVSRQPNGSTLRVADGVHAVLDSLRPTLPPGVRLEKVYDQSELVRDSIASVRDAMLIGLALAVVVLLIFLGNLRVTLAAALTVPLTMAATMVALQLTHESLNLMSLGGLAVAIGLVIDDAVVVVENIERRLRLHPDEPPADVVRQASDEIFPAVAGSTITTVVVFAPLGLLQGVVGAFFRSFSLALGVSVTLSLFFAITLIPALASRWPRVDHTAAPKRRWLRELPLDRVRGHYGQFVRLVLRRHLVAAGLAVGLLALGLLTFRTVGTGFLPEMDEGGFIIDYFTPTGSSLAESDRQLRVIERILLQDPAVQAFSRRTGSQLGLFVTEPNSGDFTVLLKPRGVRKESSAQVMDRIRAKVAEQAPAVQVELVQLLQDFIGDLAGAPRAVEIKVFGSDYDATARAAESIAAAIEPVPGLVDLQSGVHGMNPELRVELDPARVARLGVTAEQVDSQATGALFGSDAGTVRGPDGLIPVRARLADTVRYSRDVVNALPIWGPAGWAPLGTLGTVVETGDPYQLLRENLRPLVRVTADVSGRSLGQIMQDVRAKLRAIALPPGVSIEYGGQYASQQQSFRQMLMVVGFAAGAVLLVMVAQFSGFGGPLMILLAAPLGLAGAFGGLALSRVPFNVSSFMGLILLIGLIVKNGIILFDAAKHFRAEGMAPDEALAHAGEVRLRPILMTTLCTLAGLAPLAFGWGAGADLQRPLAIAVIGGLTLSTLVTLLLLPAGLAAVRALD
jgi:CzcA family heavy metal efflux pump